MALSWPDPKLFRLNLLSSLLVEAPPGGDLHGHEGGTLCLLFGIGEGNLDPGWMDGMNKQVVHEMHSCDKNNLKGGERQ